MSPVMTSALRQRDRGRTEQQREGHHEFVRCHVHLRFFMSIDNLRRSLPFIHEILRNARRGLTFIERRWPLFAFSRSRNLVAGAGCFVAGRE
jgi:hypothetical protein